MATRSNDAPLIVIVGPTASGKTALAVEQAHLFGGEIICADSRTVYKGMDIGTAKPTAAERALVPHWGLDLVEPGEHFSAADFKQYAEQKIADIRSRGHVPFLVGGSGLYVDGVLFDYQFGQKAPSVRREWLETLSVQELQDYCYEHNVMLPENKENKRYLVRAIEQNGVNQARKEQPRTDAIIVGIATDSTILRQRIAQRAEHLFENGMVEEAKALGKKYGWESEAMTGNIYRLVRQFEAGELSAAELVERNALADWHLAKRQLTWLKRNRFIQWLPLEDARRFLQYKLSPN